jgi:ElaB/YqjD/DUF883 family membrane-anchored ribosome-binding protein
MNTIPADQQILPIDGENARLRLKNAQLLNGLNDVIQDASAVVESVGGSAADTSSSLSAEMGDGLEQQKTALIERGVDVTRQPNAGRT